MMKRKMRSHLWEGHRREVGLVTYSAPVGKPGSPACPKLYLRYKSICVNHSGFFKYSHFPSTQAFPSKPAKSRSTSNQSRFDNIYLREKNWQEKKNCTPEYVIQKCEIHVTITRRNELTASYIEKYLHIVTPYILSWVGMLSHVKPFSQWKFVMNIKCMDLYE